MQALITYVADKTKQDMLQLEGQEIVDQIRPYLEPVITFTDGAKVALLADLNAELIVTYRAIRDNPDELIDRLQEHHDRHTKEYYYETRSAKPASPLELAAWFIYLNRTCWNGLYRVNLRNEFNVPIGTKTDVVMDSDNFPDVSRLLKDVDLRHGDFEATIDAADEGDFVFIDPPYTVKHNFNGFVKYNDRMFSWEDQERLRDAVGRAVTRGAKVMVLNANHKSIRQLYEGVGRQTPLRRASVLAGNAAYRVHVEELMIQSWAPADGAQGSESL